MSQHLNNTVREWRILVAVQPVFANRLPWLLLDSLTIEDDPASTSVNDSRMSAEIDINKLPTLFWADMVAIGVSLLEIIDLDLTEQSFHTCLDKITQLLLFLEQLIRDDILDRAPIQDADDDRDREKTVTTDTLSKLSNPESSWYILDWIWPSATPIMPPTNTAECPPAEKGIADSPSSPASSTSEHDTYRRLEAMALLLRSEAGDKEDLVAVCQKFVQLEHTLAFFGTGVYKAGSVRGCLETAVSDLCGQAFPLPAAKRVSPTRWESTEPWDLSNRLFLMLQKQLQACSDRDHSAKFGLSGFELDLLQYSDDTLGFNIFVSSCHLSRAWQESRCIPIAWNIQNPHKYAVVHSVCRSAEISKLANRPLEIKYDSHNLYEIKTVESPYYDGDSPGISLATLIEEGYLEETSDDSAKFNMNDKAVLALSLARCIVHLWQGLWIKEPWQAEAIQFVSNSDRVLDIHRPYITCRFTEENLASRETQGPAVFQSFLLAFARLLVEIETGTIILDESSLASVADIEKAIFGILEQRRDKYGRGDYNAAVHGCFHIKAILKKQQKELPDSDESGMRRLRRAFYGAVVENLEGNFNQVQDQTRALQSRSIYLSKTPAGFADDYDSPEMDSYTDFRNHSDSQFQDTALKSMRTSSVKPFFFDGESSTTPTADDRATIFFVQLESFRQQYIHPNIPVWGATSNWRRIKVAILDTGVDQRNTNLRSIADDIKQARRKQDKSSPIKSVKSFTKIPEDERGIDTCGHGTHVAWLLLKAAPDVDVYIAKVAVDVNLVSTSAIVEALDWATREVKVDIINMSFGSRAVDGDIEKAIRTAKDSAIFFAAASNTGRNAERTFPASDPSVIGIHSLDGLGNNSGGLNPPPMTDRHNFGTLGLGIDTVWKGKNARKSGSSYSTPVAAGIAANLLLWIDYMSAHRKEVMSRGKYQYLRSSEGMRYLFKTMSTKTDSGDIDYVAPWLLYPDDSDNSEVEGEPDRDRVLGILLKNGLPPMKGKRQ